MYIRRISYIVISVALALASLSGYAKSDEPLKVFMQSENYKDSTVQYGNNP